MREVLFRGKRKDNGEWVEGYYTFYPYGFSEKWKPEHAIRDTLEIVVKLYIVDPETVCQYTGLKDKNGRKIFNGDIVKTILCIDNHNKPLYEYGKIIYDNKNAAFLISCDEHLLEIRIWGNIEVIGNIFDNPELLVG